MLIIVAVDTNFKYCFTLFIRLLWTFYYYQVFSAPYNKNTDKLAKILIYKYYNSGRQKC